jgi:hypothetical protein
MKIAVAAAVMVTILGAVAAIMPCLNPNESRDGGSGQKHWRRNCPRSSRCPWLFLDHPKEI